MLLYVITIRVMVQVVLRVFTNIYSVDFYIFYAEISSKKIFLVLQISLLVIIYTKLEMFFLSIDF
jgi:hypothetical protein